MAFGPEGALYVLDYGTGYFNGDANSALYRYDYLAGANRAPTAVAAANKTSGQAPLTVAFSSAGSSDPEGSALTYSWAFGDGTTSTAANPTKTYTANGTYNVTLTVRDPDGATGTASVQVGVGNTAPTVTINSPANGQLFAYGDTVPFNFTAGRPRGRHGQLRAGQDDLRPGPRQPRPPDHLGQRLLRLDHHPGRR